MSFFKRLAIFIIILAAMITFLGLLPGIAHSAKIRSLAKISKLAPIRLQADAPK